MPLIQNYTVYNERMEAGIKDKLWFVDNLLPEINTVIDFGCADCALGRALGYYYPNQFRYIGIDNDAHMRELGSEAGFTVVEDILDLDTLNIDFDKTVMVFSSVIHEIAHYCGEHMVEVIFREVRAERCRPKQIAIRDMSLESNDLWFDELTKMGIETAIEDSPYKFRYEDFVATCKEQKRNDEDWWGLEFLLKYTYVENWKREKAERYLWNWDSIIYRLLNMYYNQDCSYSFNMPYQVRIIRKDFNYNLYQHTHRKVLYTRAD